MVATAQTVSTESQVTLILLSGNAEQIQEWLHSLTSVTAVQVIKLDEAAIIRFREMLQHLRPKLRQAVLCFGCKDLDLQRYQFVLKSYLLLSNAPHGYILDEQGRHSRLNPVTYFFVDVPKLFAELVAGTFVVVITFIRLTLLKLVLAKSKRNKEGI